MVDPTGKIIAALDENEGILLCEIDLDEVDDFRARLPIMSGLREDVYDVAR